MPIVPVQEDTSEEWMPSAYDSYEDLDTPDDGI